MNMPINSRTRFTTSKKIVALLVKPLAKAAISCGTCWSTIARLKMLVKPMMTMIDDADSTARPKMPPRSPTRVMRPMTVTSNAYMPAIAAASVGVKMPE